MGEGPKIYKEIQQWYHVSRTGIHQRQNRKKEDNYREVRPFPEVAAGRKICARMCKCVAKKSYVMVSETVQAKRPRDQERAGNKKQNGVQR